MIYAAANGNSVAFDQAQMGVCPHCGGQMEVGDEDPSERICDTCVEKANG